MRKMLFLAVLSALTISASAQVTKSYKSHTGKTIKVTGHQTFAATTQFSNDAFYEVKSGTLFVYAVSIQDDGTLFSHHTQQVALSGLNFKEYSISDMNKGSTLPFKGWHLRIDTKKKVECTSTMDTFFGAPGVDKIIYVALLFNTKEEAQKTYEKLKAEASKK